MHTHPTAYNKGIYQSSEKLLLSHILGKEVFPPSIYNMGRLSVSLQLATLTINSFEG